MSLVRRSGFPIFFLAGAVVLFFFRALLLGEVFNYRDLGFFHYPLRHVWVSELLQGHLPFLNPYLNGGQPLLSNPNYSVFYPGNLLYLVLPFDAAWNFLLAGHVFWAMLGFYFLALDLGNGRPAAVAGAFVIGFGGPFLSCLTYYNLLITGAWIPWVLLLWRRALGSPSRHSGRAMLALSAMLLAGEPTALLIAAAVLCGIWIQSASASPDRVRCFTQGIRVLLPSLLIACIQWIPALLWLPHTSRGEGMDFRFSAAYWSLHPARLIEFFAPWYFGDVMSPFARDFWGGPLSDGGYPYVLKIYCGWLPWVLAPLAWRRKAGKLALLTAAIGVLLSFGHRLPGYEFAYHLLPPFRIVRYPEKFLILAQLGLAVATALGVTELARGRSAKASLVVGAGLLGSLCIAGLFVTGFARDAAQRAEQGKALAQAAAYGALAMGAVWSIIRWKPRSSLALPLLLAIDIVPVTLPLPATIPADELHRRPEVLHTAPELIQSNVLHLGEDQEDAYFAGGMEPDRLMREALHPFVGMVSGMSYGAASDVDRMTWKTSLRRAASIRRSFPAPASIETMRRCGLSRILSLQPVFSQQLELETNLRWTERNQLFLYRLPGTIPPVHRESGEPVPHWEIESPYRIRIRTEGSGSIIIQRNALPGWTCLVNGKPVSIEQTEDGMIRLPAGTGTREILLTYFPPGLTAGMIVAAVGILLGLLSALAVAPGAFRSTVRD